MKKQYKYKIDDYANQDIASRLLSTHFAGTMFDDGEYKSSHDKATFETVDLPEPDLSVNNGGNVVDMYKIVKF